MAEFGLSNTGLLVPRSSDWLELIRSQYEAELTAAGLDPSVDWNNDTFLGLFSIAIAARMGDLSEFDQAVYDSWNPNNAVGIQLDSLARLTGVTRNAPTVSTCEVTLSGTALTIIPQGSLVQGGGEGGTAQWVIPEDTFLDLAGSRDITVEATVAGAVSANPGDINRIVTPITGWSSVTNAGAAELGEPLESDADLRVRREQSSQIQGASSLKAIRAALLDLDYLTNAVVFDNDANYPQVIQGKLLAAHSIQVVVHPDPVTTDEREEIAATIWANLTGGIYTNGADVVATVTDEAGAPKTIRYDFATLLSTDTTVTLVLAAGYSLGDVTPSLDEAIEALYAALDVGEPIYDLSINSLAAGVEGVLQATTLFNGATSSVVPTIAELLTSGTVTITT